MSGLNREEIKQKIQAVLDIGGTVRFSYKEKLKDWYEDGADISLYRGSYHSSTFFSDRSLDNYIEQVFTRKNAHYFMEYVLKLVDDDEDIENLSKEEEQVYWADFLKHQKALGLNGALNV